MEPFESAVPAPDVLRAHDLGSCPACGTLLLSSGLFLRDTPEPWLGVGARRPATPRSRSRFDRGYPRECFPLGHDLRNCRDPQLLTDAAKSLWDGAAALSQEARTDGLRALASCPGGRGLLVAMFREYGRFVLAEFLDVGGLSYSATARCRVGREVASLLLENLPLLEGSPLDHESCWSWSGTGVWLMRSFAGFLPDETVLDLPLALFLEPPHPGTGPCVSARVHELWSTLDQPAGEVFISLLPEWSGSTRELAEMASRLS